MLKKLSRSFLIKGTAFFVVYTKKIPELMMGIPDSESIG
ncbi:hypothetical protein SAMN05518672_101526 [Chitinophaga sp. CF118]|nr:hypothetical protein SAMN05518672_101526 [Chitinophaga sp. CF118]